MSIAYTVTARFEDEATREEFIRWLEEGHVDRVIAGGAHGASIVRMDRPSPADPIEVEVRYVFTTRETLDRYLTEHAPALRAEGLARFPPACGVAFRRSVGQIV